MWPMIYAWTKEIKILWGFADLVLHAHAQGEKKKGLGGLKMS